MRETSGRIAFSFGILALSFLLVGCGAEPVEEIEAPDAESRPYVVHIGSREKEYHTAEEYITLLWEEGSHYAYDSLGETEQILYREIAENLGTEAESFEVSQEALSCILDADDLDKVFQCVLLDHPELFYVLGYSYSIQKMNETIVSVTFQGNYSQSFEEAALRRILIERKVQPILEKARVMTDDYEKIKLAYESVIQLAEYDERAEDNQNLYSVFINHSSVCQGYSKAFQFLVNRMGIPCIVVQGETRDGELHAWNLVCSNGSYYYVDTTWGDITDGAKEASYPGEVDYSYLCITTRDLLTDHRIDTVLPMPECVDVADNYYVREGCYFQTFEREKFQDICTKAKDVPDHHVSIKCASQTLYEEMFYALVENGEIRHFLQEESGTIAYNTDANRMTMTFWVTNE